MKLGKTPMEKIQKKLVSRELRDFRRSAHTNAAKLTTKEVSTAIKSLKLC
jgi:hypothetical protein